MQKHEVYVTVPARPDFKGRWAIGRFFPNGQSGPHAVTDEELARLRANKQLAVSADAPLPKEELPEDEKALLQSFRRAKELGVELELSRVKDLEQNAQFVRDLQRHVQDLEGALARAQQRVQELEAAAKTPPPSEPAAKAQTSAETVPGKRK